MLEVCAETIGLIIMTTTGFYIIKKITNSTEKLFQLKNIILIFIAVIIPLSIYRVEYKWAYTLVTYLINIIVYKFIFKEAIEKSIILTSVAMIITFIADLFFSIIIMSFIDVADIRQIWYLRIFSNIVIALICISIVKILEKKKSLFQINKISNIINNTTLILFLVLLTVVITIFAYNSYMIFQLNVKYILNIILIIVFFVLLYIFLKEKSNYENLSSEYDNLFSYIQTFEDWIEKEQLNRHEYKNQLAVLRCLTKEKKVKDKIDEILEDNINIEGQAVTNLKNLPKGGIKGLMYYKAAIAQKHKINLTTDVSIEEKGILSKLSEKDIRILCKLIGIYFDNAIEAAAESRKKNLTIEVYELKDKVSFVFSNTFKRHKNMKDRNKKGVSSKGEGRGNGLYFASKLIKENPWIEEKQEIIERYYIEQLTIKKNITK
jgi:two-component system sensor histidine kinase AgrC